VSVVVPCRNESGNIAEIVRRVPELGTGTEIVFVEGGSTDDTRAEIERQIELHPERQIALHLQEGSGKADAVRLGFVRARGDVLIVLDADLTVAPEDFPKFYEALAAGRAELVNGSRLVYGLEPGAMRFLNLIGNKAFSLLLSFLTGQYVKDTLCGTKALRRVDYDEIAAGQDALGTPDPFGDFDLLLGAARLGLKIVDLPVRYGARRYGSTNISRFRNGWQLLRMTARAFWRLRVVPILMREATSASKAG
jgi:glycosyltransferase involved in cell wall biosynthesis